MTGVLPSLADISFVDQSALRDIFIDELRAVGFRAIAEQRLGLSGCCRKWIEECGMEFERRVYDAEMAFNGVIVAEMIRRGVHGVPRKKFYKGETICTLNETSGKHEPYIEHEYSDSLLQSLAQARMPEFRTTRQEVEHSGTMGVEHGGQIKVGVRVLEHEDWYGTNNATAPHRLAAASDGSPTGNNTLTGPIQSGGMREEIRQDRNRIDDDAEGSRVIQGPVAGSN